MSSRRDSIGSADDHTDNDRNDGTFGLSDAQQYFPETLFDVNNFGSGFKEEEFIETLTYRLLNVANKDSSVSYADKFKNLFERSLGALENLMEQVNADTEELIEETQRAEEQHKSKMQELNSQMEQITEIFKVLEDRINKVGNTTVQIGNRLETVDKQKKRAQESKLLIEYFMEFNKDEYNPDYFRNVVLPQRLLPPIFSDPKNINQAAIEIQKLNNFAMDLEKVRECKKGVTNIQIYSQNLDKQLSDEFNDICSRLSTASPSRLQKLIRRMKEISDILSAFNGGNSCVVNYVNRRFLDFLGIKEEKGPEAPNGNIDEDREEEEEENGDKDDVDDEEDRYEDEERNYDEEEEEEEDDNYRDRSDEEDDYNEEDYDNEEEDSYKPKKSSKDKKINTKLRDRLALRPRSGSNTSRDSRGSRSSRGSRDSRSSSGNTNQRKRENGNASANTKLADDLDFDEILNKKAEIKRVEDLDFLFEKIEKTCIREYGIIKQVFPQPNLVMRKLLTRIIEETIMSAVNVLLVQPTGVSAEENLQYLLTFERVYDMCLNFVKDRLKGFDENEQQKNNNDFRSAINQEELMDMVVSIFSDAKSSYIVFESRALEDLYRDAMASIKRDERELALLEQQLQQQLAKKNKELARGLPLPQVPISTHNLKQVQSARRNPLKLDVIISLIHSNSAAIKRCRKLSHEITFHTSVVTIYNILLKYINSLLTEGIDAGIEALQNNSKQKPSFDFFRLVQVENLALQNIQRHFDSEVLPHITSHLELRMQCLNAKGELLTRLEAKVIKGLEMNLKVMIDYSKHLLETEQKKTDYSIKPKEFNPSTDNAVTTACSKCVEFIEEQVELIKSALFGRNREEFLMEFGLQFYRVLTTHLKSFTVSSIGAVRLMRDITDYQNCVKSFGVGAVEDKFNLLREISNIFLVAAENIEAVLMEIPLSKVSKEELLSYVKMRHDFKTAKLGKLPFFKEFKE